jgi:HK97 gp10 family phage protein
MSNTSGIKVKGLRSSIKALQAIGVDAKDIKSAGNEAGEIVAREARTLAPSRTGALRASIRVSKALNRVSVSAGNNGRVPYANPIHWGWFKRNIKPQPFFVKALGITRDEVYQTYYRSIDRLIQTNSTKGTDE